MKAHVLTVLILIAAFGAYALHFELGVAALLVTGGALEMVFWIRALHVR